MLYQYQCYYWYSHVYQYSANNFNESNNCFHISLFVSRKVSHQQLIKVLIYYWSRLLITEISCKNSRQHLSGKQCISDNFSCWYRLPNLIKKTHWIEIGIQWENHSEEIIIFLTQCSNFNEKNLRKFSYKFPRGQESLGFRTVNLRACSLTKSALATSWAVKWIKICSLDNNDCWLEINWEKTTITIRYWVGKQQIILHFEL